MAIGTLAKRFVTVLELNHIHYKHIKLRDLYDRLVVVFSGRQIPEITVNFIFDDDNNTVQIRVIDIIPKIPERKLHLVLDKINELNNEYTFGKFCIQSDHNLIFGIDALVNNDTAGSFCYQLMIKAIKICDDSYLQLNEI